jgi:hypothetical protein
MLDIHYRIYGEDGERDEDAYNAYVESIWRAFVQAPEGQQTLKADPRCGQWTDIFLRYYFDYIGSSAADITAQDIREVLFELFPQKVSVAPDKAPEIIRELRAFGAFLGREFGLPQAGAIQTFLDDGAILKLKNLLADPRNYGMAKSFFMTGQQTGFDMTTEEGCGAFQAVYNASLASRAAPAAPIFGSLAAEVQHTSTKALRKKRKAQRQARKKNRR